MILWNETKSRELKRQRGIGFEDVIYHIENGLICDVIKHPRSDKYGSQKVYVINICDYIYLVPFVESNEIIFLKTIIPSRKFTRRYLGGKNG